MLPEEYGCHGPKLRKALKDLAEEASALAKKERRGVGKARVLGSAAGGSREMSLLFLPHHEMFQINDLKHQ